MCDQCEVLKSERDAALDQVVALREALIEAHEHVGAEGYSEGSETKVLGALEDTSATAQQRVEAIRREAVEKFKCAPDGYIHCVEAAPDLSPLAEEMVRARLKFPGPRLLGSALAEEVGEMADAWLSLDPSHCRKEALQVACVAMRIYQEGNVGHGQSFDVLRLMAALEAPARANLEPQSAAILGEKEEG